MMGSGVDLVSSIKKPPKLNPNDVALSDHSEDNGGSEDEGEKPAPKKNASAKEIREGLKEMGSEMQEQIRAMKGKAKAAAAAPLGFHLRQPQKRGAKPVCAGCRKPIGREETCVTNAWIQGKRKLPTKQSFHAKAKCLKSLSEEHMAEFMELDWSESKAVQKVVKAMERSK